MRVNAVIPQAGFGLWMDFNALGLSHEGLTRMLVDDARVAVSDGASFGVEGTRHGASEHRSAAQYSQHRLNNIREAVNKLPR